MTLCLSFLFQCPISPHLLIVTSLNSGWILLALAVALVNASSGIIVLYVLLCAVGWILVLWFIVRPLLIWWCRATGVGKEKPPSELLVCAVMFLVLIR